MRTLDASAIIGRVCAMPGLYFPLDDSYITLSNARALLTGSDVNFGVPALVGATSQAHLAIVAALGMFMPLAAASLLVNIASAFAYAAGLWRMSMALRPSAWVAAAVVAAGLLFANAPFQLVNGLETGLAMAAVAWALVLAIEKSRTALPLLCGLMPFIRPELGVLSVALIATRAWRSHTALARDLMLAALVAAPFVVWIVASTGTLAPMTANAKRAFFAEASEPFGKRLASFLIELVRSKFGAVILAIALLIPTRGAVAIAARVFIFGVFALFVMSMPTAPAHNYGRYLYPLLPAALLLILAARTELFTRVALAAVIAIACLVAPREWPNLPQRMNFGREMAAVADWTRDNLPRGSRILIHDAGYIAWATDFELVDLVGLKTPSSIEEHVRWTLPSHGAQRFRAISAIAERANPSHLIALKEGFWAELATDLSRAGWTLRAVRTPAGQGYVVYEIKRNRPPVTGAVTPP